MQRQAKKLTTFGYDIQYCLGNKNFTPDLLSWSLYYVSSLMMTVLAKELSEAAALNGYVSHVALGSKFFVTSTVNGVKICVKKSSPSVLRTLLVARAYKGCRRRPQLLLKMRPVHFETPFTRICPIETQYPFELVTMDTRHVTLPLGRKDYFLVAVGSSPNGFKFVKSTPIMEWQSLIFFERGH